jgi:predicted glycosyltransferase involved in capsule biosynthesis
MNNFYKYPISTKSITFCVTCRNRLWQLKHTLRKNLEALDDDLELTLVDYGSTDGLASWVHSNFQEFTKTGMLNFFEVKNEVQWNVSRAKNLAHRISNGEYLFSLDADNFISREDIDKIRNAKHLKGISHQWSGRIDGSYGRVGCPRELFFSVGGYDENLLPMGFEDVDFLRRTKNLVKNFKLGAPKIDAVKNTFEQSVSEFSGKVSDSKEFYVAMIKLNNKISNFKIAMGAARDNGFATYMGALNGKLVVIDGFDQIREI